MDARREREEEEEEPDDELNSGNKAIVVALCF